MPKDKKYGKLKHKKEEIYYLKMHDAENGNNKKRNKINFVKDNNNKDKEQSKCKYQNKLINRNKW